MPIKYIANTVEEQQFVRLLIDEIQHYQEEGRSRTYPITCIYVGRNQLYKVNTEQGGFVVKCFRRPRSLQAIYYSYFGKTKAKRSHTYAVELMRRGIGVPESLGYAVETNALGLLGRSYYICRALEGGEPHIHPHARGWAMPEGFMPALASFLLSVHRAGVEHLDLSPGNILYHRDAEGVYHFSLIDLNRMKLHHKPLSLSLSIQNMHRLMSASSPNSLLAYHYAVARGEKPSLVIAALEREVSRFWSGRLYKLSYRYAHRVYGMGLLAFLLMLIKYRWILLRGDRDKAFRLYQKYLQTEDIRGVERHCHGFDYRYVSAE